jgi:GTP-binding protein
VGLPELRFALAVVVAVDRAATPAAPAPRIVVRPKAIDSEQFQVEPDPEVDGGFIVRGSRPERWILQTDFNNDEAVGFLADRLARLGVEAHLAAHGARPGAPVTIGNVTFDWEPTTLAGVDIVPTGRGTDLRLDQVDRIGASERKVLHRLRRGLDVEGHTLADFGGEEFGSDIDGRDDDVREDGGS